MNPPLLALVGERDPEKPAHAGIEASLGLFEAETGRSLEHEWISTAELTGETAPERLARAAGVWCAPGSPYADTEGALRAIAFARSQRRAFLGTCGGFQHALMEYARDVLRLPAAHAEIDPEATDALIAKLSCSLVGARAKVLADAGGWYAETVGSVEREEEFNCNYGMSPTFEPGFTGSALDFIARDEAGQVRAFRLRGHPFFMGTLFQPERTALRGVLHPLVRAFLAFAESRHPSDPATASHQRGSQ